ncbi:hypothetical protein AB0B21_38570 [Streptomyces rimosus]|uniref:hypothetical protein n=1 Tax=Streptomyces rimosus TaxID=1927 RepID=UPI0005182CD7|nr:hypothetical protein [Streptomyces rimosus]
MWSSIIAVLGTLAGVALASATQLLTERRTRADRQRQEVAGAVHQLLDAVLAYREQYWMMIADRRQGRQESREDRAALNRARTGGTRAGDGLALATADPTLSAAANAAAWSAIELDDIPLGQVTDCRFAEDVEAALAAGRERSRDAPTALREAAAAYIHQLQGARRD